MNFEPAAPEIIPAIIGRDFLEIKNKIDRLDRLTDWVSLDVIDGKFAPVRSWDEPADLQAVLGQIKIEIHLMVEQPENQLKGWLAVADRVVVHYESTEALAEVLGAIRDSSAEAGLALLLPTPLTVLANFIELVDVIQLMGIARIGYQGEPFDEQVTERVKILRRRYPNVKIAVDGGVSASNAGELAAAGADCLVAGSALWESADLAAALEELRQAVARRQ